MLQNKSECVCVHLKNSRLQTFLSLFCFCDGLKSKMSRLVSLGVCTANQSAHGYTQTSCVLDSLQYVTKLHQPP